jgi:hypothetical protein
MPTRHFVKEAHASPAIVWGVLPGHPGMTRWAGARNVKIERPGADVPNGVGTGGGAL